MEKLPQSQHNATPHEPISRLELLQQQKESEVPEAEELSVQVVIILLDKDLYGIRILSVREILKYIKTTWIPCTPPYILGVTSVRGEIHIVVKLREFLDLGPARLTEQSRIILIESENLVAGLLVDDMLDIMSVSEQAILPLTDTTPGKSTQYIEGKFHWNDQCVTLLNMNAIIQGIVVDQGEQYAADEG